MVKDSLTVKATFPQLGSTTSIARLARSEWISIYSTGAFWSDTADVTTLPKGGGLHAN